MGQTDIIWLKDFYEGSGCMLTLKQFRNKYHLSQRALAEILGTTPTTLSKYETGQWMINHIIIDKIKELYHEDIRPLKPKTLPKVWIKKE